MMCSDDASTVLPDWFVILHYYPAMNRWAAINRPSGLPSGGHQALINTDESKCVAYMKARTRIIGIFDVSGGIAGASMILAALLLLVSAPGSSYKLLQAGIAVLFLGMGALLALRRELRRTRVVIGAIFLVSIVGSLIAALLLPGRFSLHQFGTVWLKADG